MTLIKFNLLRSKKSRKTLVKLRVVAKEFFIFQNQTQKANKIHFALSCGIATRKKVWKTNSRLMRVSSWVEPLKQLRCVFCLREIFFVESEKLFSIWAEFTENLDLDLFTENKKFYKKFFVILKVFMLNDQNCVGENSTSCGCSRKTTRKVILKWWMNWCSWRELHRTFPTFHNLDVHTRTAQYGGKTSPESACDEIY